MGRIGLLANPASGKDVRRLVARASVFDNQEKRAIIRRALIGATTNGATDFVYHPDAHGIALEALNEVGVTGIAVDSTQTGTALDTISAARAMRDLDCDVVMTLGGDGTNRAFCLGWQDAPLLPISTGTNNVFPNVYEATIAGAAAGLVASGKVSKQAFSQQKCVEVEIESERPDLALIDALLSEQRFVGAKALLEPDQFRSALLTRADPAAVGITAIGGLLQTIGPQTNNGLWLEFGGSEHTITAPIAPGLYRDIGIRGVHALALNQSVRCIGPGTLAFDGERERTLKPEQAATLTITRNGPLVLDVKGVMRNAVERGVFGSFPFDTAATGA